jgi:class 3 adenylate cyclase
MTVSRDPNRLIAELNDIFTAFDRIVEQFGCERLKTIGDAYVAVSGLPEANPEHARNIARAALRFRHYLERRNATSEFEWTCRIGIHSGPVIGSVVGVQKYVYDIFGPGMNMAARLEQICEPMEILVSDETHAQIVSEFRMTDLGVQDIRGFGETQVWRLDGSFHPVND